MTLPQDTLAMNEDSFWSGGLLNRTNQDALEQMPNIQELVRQGAILEAERLASFAYVGEGVSVRHYEPLTNFQIMMNNSNPNTTVYERYLDVSDASAGVYYTQNGTAYFREYIASYPDDLIAVRIASNV